jgi:spermidine synthase
VGLHLARQRALIAVALLAPVIVLLARATEGPPFLGRLASGARILLVDEGPQDTTAVIERGANQARQRLILSNGVSYAGNAPDAQRYMALLGHLPVLFSRDASRALVICVGTGTTDASLAVYDEVRVLDLVDISPVVHKTLPLFADVNRGVWRDRRATIHEADGRQFMTRAKAGYGVITLEPPPPRAAGAASLYTLELYQQARRALAKGGIIAQWLPLHGMTESEILMLARTFVRIFPESALFILNPDEAALLGSPEPLAFAIEPIARRLRSAPVRAALHAIGFASDEPEPLAAELLSLAPVRGQSLRAIIGDGPVVTDDRPLIEQFATLLGSQVRLDPDGRRGILRRLASVPFPWPDSSSQQR